MHAGCVAMAILGGLVFRAGQREVASRCARGAIDVPHRARKLLADVARQLVHRALGRLAGLGADVVTRDFVNRHGTTLTRRIDPHGSAMHKTGFWCVMTYP